MKAENSRPLPIARAIHEAILRIRFFAGPFGPDDEPDFVRGESRSDGFHRIILLRGRLPYGAYEAGFIDLNAEQAKRLLALLERMAHEGDTWRGHDIFLAAVGLAGN